VEIKILKPGQILKLDCKYIIVDRPIKTLNLLTYIILDILTKMPMHVGYQFSFSKWKAFKIHNTYKNISNIYSWFYHAYNQRLYNKFYYKYVLTGVAASDYPFGSFKLFLHKFTNIFFLKSVMETK
jgi:hypothetical protein